MFTGLVESIGIVQRVSQRGNYLLVTIAPENVELAMMDGDSICCDGACLTVVSRHASAFVVEASQVTVAKTTLGAWKMNDRLHLERALRADSRLGGHFVTGHVDCVGAVNRTKNIGESVELVVKYDQSFDQLVVAKGAIAINGVSLTVNETGTGWLSVNLIPFTLKATSLGSLKSGEQVNLEFDILGKYVLRQKQAPERAGLTMEKLLESGW